MGGNNSRLKLKEEPIEIEENATRIDLRNKNLQKVPEAILQLNLSWLSLSQNRLTNIPIEIGKLVNLKVFRIFSNNFETFPKQISRLGNLTTLDIGKNQIKEVGAEIGNCVSLTELNLQSNLIIELPEEFGNLTNLKSLNLYINHLTNLPNSFSKLIGIESLDLAHNRFTILPQVVGTLTNLTTLSLIANGFKELPNELANLSLLRKLDIRCNYITEIPEIFPDNLKELRTLLVKNNRLTSLPNNIGNFQSLTECRVEVNNIQNIPDSIGNLQTLKSLYIFENDLKNIPDSLGALSMLSELDISNNLISELPESMGQLTNLDILYIASNIFTDLPQCLSTMSALTDLAICGNHLNEISQELSKSLTPIGKLNLNHNKIKSIPEEIAFMSNLAILELADNIIEIVPETLSELSNLNYINLSHNQISSLPKSFTQLGKLHKFYISYNLLENFEFDDSFNQLKIEEFVGSGNNFGFPNFVYHLGATLKYLDLSANRIKEIDPLIRNLSIIETLILSCNEIEKLPDEFIKLITLTELDLSHNLLTNLPNELGAHLTSLTDIDLSGNSITELSEDFCNIPFLQLKIAHNKISQLPKIEAKWLSSTGNIGFFNKNRKRKDTQDLLGNNQKRRKDSQIQLVNDWKFEIGWVETRGRRPDQQDTIAIVPNFRGRESEVYLGLFDGHGGSESAEYSASNLHFILRDLLMQITFGDEINALLKQSFFNTQKEVAKRHITDGTAANIVYISNGYIYVANAGDARSILCRNGEPYPLSKDHKPDHQDERERIEKAGGFVTESKRVNGVLALSRAIGDCYLQPPVTCEPVITKTLIQEGDTHIITGCDGLWDVASNDKVCEIVMRYPTASLAAAALRDYAYTTGSTDNISIIVLQISHI